MSAAQTRAKTFGELRRAAILNLREKAIESAETDARLLLGSAAGLSAVQLISSDNEIANDAIVNAFDRLIERRISGEPVARILGEKEFWSLRFKLGAETLVPRPETETIVEAALDHFKKTSRAIRILDLGTGTGAILAALLSELPQATGVAVDRSEAALRLARQNFRNLSLEGRVSYLCGYWATAIGGTFDLVVSNPPYITTHDLALLSPEVRDHDPHLALEAGEDGFDAYRAIVNQLPERLTAEGVAVLELGQGQEQGVAALVEVTGGLVVSGAARKDLAGIPRALVIHAKR